MNKQENITIISGLSVDDVVVGADTSQTVMQKYGLDYDELNHNNYSIEMRYSEIGLSFYYRFDNPLKIIFNIDVILDNYRCIITKFMVFDRMIDENKICIQDVVNLFGDVTNLNYSDGNELASIAYKGIEFHASYNEFMNNVPAENIIVKKVSVFNSEREA
jgi:hypothetical protein